jgi:hypothetical protein
MYLSISIDIGYGRSLNGQQCLPCSSFGFSSNDITSDTCTGMLCYVMPCICCSQVML